MITGATDFIFGQNAVSWFEQCDIRVRNGGYYITGTFPPTGSYGTSEAP